MRGRYLSSLAATLILLSVAIYMFISTGNYIHSIIWVLASPLFLSLHPIFRNTAKELNMEQEEYEKNRNIFNFIRFSLFALGILLFVYQLIEDLL